MEERIVRLGNARKKCNCGAEYKINPVAFYMHECILRLQTGDEFTMRAAPGKLELVESIAGLLFPLKVREVSRQSVKENEKEYFDVCMKKM